MELDDLQLLCLGQAGEDTVDIMIYDPMPGGSGLLNQLLDNWEEISSQALLQVSHCPSACETACIDCLFTYHNSYYHRYLDRHLVKEKIQQWGHQLNLIHDIPPELPRSNQNTNGGKPVNDAETRLQKMLEQAGFSKPHPQHTIDLRLPLGITTPDFFYEDPDEDCGGICIYLDGMSRHLHGSPDRQQRDRAIRDELEALGYEVLSIPASALDDRTVMTNHLSRLGRILLGKQEARRIREETDWFESSS